MMLAGGALVALVLLQALVLVFGNFTRTRREARQQDLSIRLLEERIEAARAQRKKAEQQVASWSGIRKFEVAKRVPEPGDICSFYLKPHDGRPLPLFKPGQYLTFQLQIPGKDKATIRCYSLSDAPRSDYYRVSIKRVPAPKDKEVPPGLVSNFFHDFVKEGDILDCKAPGGHFFLDVENTPGGIVLIGGGIGITPVLSMINLLTADGTLKRDVYWFLGVRDRSEHPFKDHIEALAKQHDKLHLHVCYSKPGKTDVLERDYQHAERVSVELFKKTLPSNNFDYYMCGPGPFMESIVGDLEKWGVPDERVHFEAFGPASVKKVNKAAAPAAEVAAAPTGAVLEVVFAKSGKTCKWTGAVTSLLELGEANGVTLDSGCRAGNCGTCVVAVKEGEVGYANPPGAAPDKGSCLTCVGQPKTKVVLDA